MKIEDFHAGDADLFRQLVDRHSPMLLAHALRYVRDSDEAHDVVQEVWLRAYRRRRQLRTLAALPGWLLAIGRNVCLSGSRKNAVRETDVRDVAGAIPSTFGNPAERSERAELTAAIAHAVAGLPDRQRDVVVLRLLEGRSTKESAAMLDVAEGTVKAALHAALKNLRPLLRRWRDALVS